MSDHRRDVVIIAGSLCCMVGIAAFAVSKAHSAEYRTRKAIVERFVPEPRVHPKVIAKGTIYLIEDGDSLYIANDVFDCEEATIKRVHGEKRQELLEAIEESENERGK